MKGRNATLLAWLPSLVFMGLIFAVSSIPGNPNVPRLFPHADKIAHFMAYAVLGLLIGLRPYFKGRINQDKLRLSRGFDWVGFGIGAGYGVLDEIHQRFVPMREFSYGDMAADATGVFAGLVVSRMLLIRMASNGNA